MAKKITSIIASDMNRCFACGKYVGIEIHHAVFGTANRKPCDKLKLVVPLCYECHGGTQGVHGRDGDWLRRQIEIEARIAFDREYPDGYQGKSFREIFGKECQ